MSFSTSSGDSPLAGNEKQRFAYRGAQSQAQLVRSVKTNQVVIRKILMVLSRRTLDRNLPFRPLKPKEIVLLDVIRQLPVQQGVPNHFATYYSYEYVNAAVSTTFNADLYRLVSYWPVYNGGPAADNSGLGNEFNITSKLPLAAIARMIWQVYGSLHHLQFAGGPGSDYIVHFDLHLGNILIHWADKPANPANPAFLLPDFIVVDFESSYLYSEIKSTQFDKHPELADIERMNITVLLTLEEVAVLAPLKQVKCHPSNINARMLPGPHSPAALKLLEIYQTAKRIKDGYVAKHPSHPSHPEPPSLMEVVRLGKELEAMYLGGDADETKSPAFQRFVTEDRAKALATSRATPLTVRGTRAEALQPVDPQTGKPLELYGPWALCRNVWKAVQDGPAMRGHPDPSFQAGNAERMPGAGTGTPLVIDHMTVIEEDHANQIQDGYGQGRPIGKAPKSLRELNVMVGAFRNPASLPVLRRVPRKKALGGMFNQTMIGAFPETTDERSSSIDPMSKSDPYSSSPPSIQRGKDQRKFAFALHNDPPVFWQGHNNQLQVQPAPLLDIIELPQAAPQLQLEPASASTSTSTSTLVNYEQILANATSTHESMVSQQLNVLGDLNQQLKQGPLAEIRNALDSLDLEAKRVKRLETRQNRLHAMVRGATCECDAWLVEIEDQIEMRAFFNNVPLQIKPILPNLPIVEEEPTGKGKQKEGEPAKKPSLPETPFKKLVARPAGASTPLTAKRTASGLKGVGSQSRLPPRAAPR